MKSIRDYIKIIENAQRRHYDMELEVENWQDSEDPNDENFPHILNLGIDYSIYGKYVPARIRYDDYDHPAEYPELDSVEVYNADTGQLITDMPDDVSEYIEQAIWKHAESRRDDFDPPDRDDDYYR
jgi:hypothetical protein